MQEGKLIRDIREAARDGRLSEPFRAKALKYAVPGYAERTYTNFLPKHRVGNLGGETELFIRVGKGLYRLKR